MAKEKTDNLATAIVPPPATNKNLEAVANTVHAATLQHQPGRMRGQRLGYSEFYMREQQRGKTEQQITVAWELYCEPKSTKFKRLAMARGEKAERAVLALIPLSNPSVYEHNDHQVRYLLGKLTAAIERVKSAFEGRKETTSWSDF